MPDRIIYKHKERLPKEIVEPRLRSRLYLRAILHAEVECTCAAVATHAFQFEWGQLVGFPEYQINDEIKWNGKGKGYPEVDNVTVEGTSEQVCSTCGKWIDTLISIRSGRIIGLVPELMTKIEYSFQGPFVSDDLVVWNQYQQNWIKDAWRQLLSRHPDSEFQNCPSIN